MANQPGFDILGFGAVAVDDLLYVDEYPPADHKVHILRRGRQGGGNCGTALVAAARLGAQCAYVGALGDDPLSRYAIENFRNEGIDTEHRARRSDGRPFHSTIIVEQRRATRTVFASLDGFSGADPTRPEPELLRTARVLLLDHHGVEGSLRAARIGREAGVAVVADFERDGGGRFAELVATVDHLVVSERFARQWTGEDQPGPAAEKLFHAECRAVVVTCGPDGCWYVGVSGEAARHVPAFAVEVVDTTGCGDVFHGAYAAALAWGRDLPWRVRFASAVAALKATHPGGQAGCPRLAEVEKFLAAAGE